MTLEQFKTAWKIEDQFIVSVDDHKNTEVAKPISELANVLLGPVDAAGRQNNNVC